MQHQPHAPVKSSFDQNTLHIDVVLHAMPCKRLHSIGFYFCRLPGSNLLLGLPVVMDTSNDSVKEGDRVSARVACPTWHVAVQGFAAMEAAVGVTS